MNGDISKEQVTAFKKKMHTVIKQNDIDKFTNSFLHQLLFLCIIKCT